MSGLTLDEALERFRSVLRFALIPAAPPDAWSLNLNVDGAGQPEFVVAKATGVATSTVVEFQLVHTFVR